MNIAQNRAARACIYGFANILCLLVLSVHSPSFAGDCAENCMAARRQCAAQNSYTNCPGTGLFGEPYNPAREACLKRVPRGREQCSNESHGCFAECERQAAAQNNDTSGVAANSTDAASTASCPTNLRYLSTRLPQYNDAMLSQALNSVLETDLRQSMATARSMGYTPQSAAAATLQQARQAEQAMPTAAACIRQAANNPDQIMSQLQRGTYTFSSGSISDDCAKAYVLAYYQLVANREAAIGLACLAK